MKTIYVPHLNLREPGMDDERYQRAINEWLIDQIDPYAEPEDRLYVIGQGENLTVAAIGDVPHEAMQQAYARARAGRTGHLTLVKS